MKEQYLCLMHEGEAWGIEVRNFPVLPVGSSIDIKLPEGQIFESLVISNYAYTTEGVMTIGITEESSEMALAFRENKKLFRADKGQPLFEYMCEKVVEFE